MINRSVLIIFTFAALCGISCAGVVGTSSLYAPAVILQNNTGSLTRINLTVTTGNGKINITGPSIVGNNTLQSADEAVAYATSYLGLNASSYNFSYFIADKDVNVSGPSAGAAMSILAISALTHTKLMTNFTVTGTINPDGSIGEIGGVYDKAEAAKAHNFAFVLVPAATDDSFEQELYYLVQSTFNIPLIQVANVSQALHFATTNNPNPWANATNYSLYTKYNTSSLRYANLTCSNNCEDGAFNQLTNFTIGFARAEISTITFNRSIEDQMYAQLNESEAVANKNYLYTAADIAFLEYANAFMFSNHNTSRSAGQVDIENIEQYCSDINAPQMSLANYEYVIGGQLRQLWGIYTIKLVNSSYNVSNLDGDEVLNNLYIAGQANGWCNAATTMYGIAANINSSEYVSQTGLQNIALSRINRAAKYGVESMYFSTAENAYKNSSYAAAIVDADYAYALTSGSEAVSSMNTSQTLSATHSVLNNSNYGIWATEFSKQSMFYEQQAISTTNTTAAKTYAQQAYSTALLASQLSNDTKIIANSLVIKSAQQPPSSITQNPQPIQTTDLLNEIAALNRYINTLSILIAIIFAIDIAIILFVAKILLTVKHQHKSVVRKRMQRRKRR